MLFGVIAIKVVSKMAMYTNYSFYFWRYFYGLG
nr:MAG TPA: hypothetical protein [Caudoviricetes sp.]